MERKQRIAIAKNARLNYLIDSGMDAESIVKDMKGKVTLGFVENIMDKRGCKNDR